MPTQEQFDDLHKQLAEKYRCSPRVIQYVRSSYAQKFKGEELDKVKAIIVDHSEKVLVEIMRTYRQVKIDFVSLVLKDVQDLQQSDRRIVQLQNEMAHITGYTDKIGFRKSIIDFVGNCTEANFKAIISAHIEEPQP